MLLFWLGLTAAEATTFEESIEYALRQSPTAQMGEEDLVVARHRMGTSVSRLLPRLSLSERQIYRYNNPEKYNYSFHFGGGECIPTPESPCLPYVVVDGQLMVPEAVLSNSLSLSMVQPVAASTVVGVLQQHQGKKLTGLKVRGDSEQLVGQLVKSYGELQYQVEYREILERSLSLAEEMALAVQGMHAVGESTQLDLDKALLDVDEAQTNLAQLDRALPLYLE
ncbi:MAG: TolC family protein, partial [Proteobacteria bacterium]|nr:TolC family protein [Pseudomonadota bacterium]